MISRPGCQWVYLIMLLKISHVKKNLKQAVSDSMIDGIGIHHTYFFVETRDLFCFKQAEKVPKIPVYRLFTPGCERS